MLLEFSLHHNHEEDSAFVPAAKPGHSPIINVIAKGHRLAKPKELGLNEHGSRPHTYMARLGRTVNFAFRESQSQSAIESQIASDNGTQRAPFVLAGKSAGKKQKYASATITLVGSSTHPHTNLLCHFPFAADQ
jgi:hypothetical protein